MRVEGIVWMGVRTARHDQLRALFADVMGMEVIRAADGVTWFSLPGGEQIQIYGDQDADHTFFGQGPVVAFLVDDFASAKAEMVAAGIEFVGDGDADETRRWQHFRGPDGNLYEIMGPAT